jgi:hypothetical protein
VDDLVKSLLDNVGALGVPGAIVFSILYLLERAERKELNTKIESLTREAVGAIKDNANATDKLNDHGDELRNSINKVADGVSILAALRGRRSA